MLKFQDITIRTKVIGAFGFILLVTVVLGLFALQRLGAVNDRAADMRDNWMVATRALGDFATTTMRFRQLQAAHILAATAEEKHKEEATMRDVAGQAEAAWKIYAPTIDSDEEKGLAAQMQSGWQHYQELNQKFIGLSVSGNPEVNDFYRGEMRTTFNAFHDVLQKDIDLQVRGGNQAANEGAQIYASAKIWIVGALCFAALLCLAAGVVIVANVSRPIKRMTDAMTRLAGHDLETEIVGIGRKDEIGSMADAVQVFKDNMIEGDRLAEVQRAEQLAKEARQQRIEQLIQDFDRTVRETLDMVASASTEMNATAQSMAAVAEQTSRQALVVSSASEEASSNVQTVAAASEEMAVSIAEITRQVAQSAEIAQEAVAEASRAGTTMQGLAEAVQKIDEVVGLITNIASQTNLLALNATIEAARAGEAGKGFAVVASEVKALASQTGKATGDISSQILSIQSAAGQAVDALRAVDATIVKINDVASMIASAVEEQGAATKEISRNTQEAASGTSEVSRNITGVSEAATQTGSAATQVLAASAELDKQSEKLRGDVGKFLADILAA